MLEWKFRLAILLAFAAVLSVALGGNLFGVALNFGW
jgi:hypothetical protein